MARIPQFQQRRGIQAGSPVELARSSDARVGGDNIAGFGQDVRQIGRFFREREEFNRRMELDLYQAELQERAVLATDKVRREGGENMRERALSEVQGFVDEANETRFTRSTDRKQAQSVTQQILNDTVTSPLVKHQFEVDTQMDSQKIVEYENKMTSLVRKDPKRAMQHIEEFNNFVDNVPQYISPEQADTAKMAAGKKLATAALRGLVDSGNYAEAEKKIDTDFAQFLSEDEANALHEEVGGAHLNKLQQDFAIENTKFRTDNLHLDRQKMDLFSELGKIANTSENDEDLLAGDRLVQEAASTWGASESVKIHDMWRAMKEVPTENASAETSRELSMMMSKATFNEEGVTFEDAKDFFFNNVKNLSKGDITHATNMLKALEQQRFQNPQFLANFRAARGQLEALMTPTFRDTVGLGAEDLNARQQADIWAEFENKVYVEGKSPLKAFNETAKINFGNRATLPMVKGIPPSYFADRQGIVKAIAFTRQKQIRGEISPEEAAKDINNLKRWRVSFDIEQFTTDEFEELEARRNHIEERASAKNQASAARLGPNTSLRAFEDSIRAKNEQRQEPVPSFVPFRDPRGGQ